ncbi:hypothetical protein GDO78_014874 [Eleutherodactylus coqui]|uniref:Uncharacterized protein n=1 Tax=Eleutherodactylus coqui TaxID=57060 RepID=A0A8J6E452_ELECQ|nr:hypothetical protein GDO78_014874 [Eleutherodactylus coqui]
MFGRKKKKRKLQNFPSRSDSTSGNSEFNGEYLQHFSYIFCVRLCCCRCSKRLLSITILKRTISLCRNLAIRSTAGGLRSRTQGVQTGLGSAHRTQWAKTTYKVQEAKAKRPLSSGEVQKAFSPLLTPPTPFNHQVIVPGSGKVDDPQSSYEWGCRTGPMCCRRYSNPAGSSVGQFGGRV